MISHPAIFSKGEQCLASLPTVRVVQTCPQNEAELSRAQQQKKCEHLAKYQKCTKPATFKYHCVLNAFSNETIEVCAQEIYSQGYCVKFDEGSLLQMFGEDCTTYSNPCATRFLSSDLLQYLQCNDLLQKGMDSIRTTATPNHHNDPTRITTTPNPQNETNIGEYTEFQESTSQRTGKNQAIYKNLVPMNINDFTIFYTLVRDMFRLIIIRVRETCQKSN